MVSRLRKIETRYRGLAKNTARSFIALALSNIIMSHDRLMAQVRPSGRKADRKTCSQVLRGRD